MKKFEIVKESAIEKWGVTLYRIRCLRDFQAGDFRTVKAGELGGFVEKEENLSQEGMSWIFDEAKVYGDSIVRNNAVVRDRAVVYGNAVVRGNAVVCGNAIVRNGVEVGGNTDIRSDAEVFSHKHFITIGPIGSRSRYTTFYRSKNNGIDVACGCFNGDIHSFLMAVEKTHRGNKHAAAYRAAAELATMQIELTDKPCRKETTKCE